MYNSARGGQFFLFVSEKWGGAKYTILLAPNPKIGGGTMPPVVEPLSFSYIFVMNLNKLFGIKFR